MNNKKHKLFDGSTFGINKRYKFSNDNTTKFKLIREGKYFNQIVPVKYNDFDEYLINITFNLRLNNIFKYFIIKNFNLNFVIKNKILKYMNYVSFGPILGPYYEYNNNYNTNKKINKKINKKKHKYTCYISEKTICFSTSTAIWICYNCKDYIVTPETFCINCENK